MYKLFFYQDRRGRRPVFQFIESLSYKAQAKVGRYLKLLKQKGPQLIRPYADHVRGKLHELRIKTRDGNVRILHFVVGNRVILLHAFKKKTDSIEERDIRKAEDLMISFVQEEQGGELDA